VHLSAYKRPCGCLLFNWILLDICIGDFDYLVASLLCGGILQYKNVSSKTVGFLSRDATHFPHCCAFRRILITLSLSGFGMRVSSGPSRIATCLLEISGVASRYTTPRSTKTRVHM
jgi:hypothetical protein